MRRQAERGGQEAQQDPYRLSPQCDSLIAVGLFSPLKDTLHQHLSFNPYFSPLFPQAQVFIWLCSLQFQAVEIRVEHKTAWGREKGKEKKGERASKEMGQWGREGERKQIIKAVWGSKLLAVLLKQQETKRSKQLTEYRFYQRQTDKQCTHSKFKDPTIDF